MKFRSRLTLSLVLVAGLAWAQLSLHLVDIFPVTETACIEIKIDMVERGVAKSASGVMPFVVETFLAGFGSNGLSVHVEGEAIAVEGTNPIIFATLVGQTSRGGFAEFAAGQCGFYADRDISPYARLAPLRSFQGPCEITWQAFPLFVRQNDRGEWEKVGVGEDVANLKPDVRVERVTLSRSTAPVTRNISSFLSFQWSDRFTVDALPNDLQLLSSAFRRGRP